MNKLIILSLTLMLFSAAFVHAQTGNLTAVGIVINNGATPSIYTGTGTAELNRYLLLLNSSGTSATSGLKTGGIVVADAPGYANPGKNDLVVKGKVAIGTPSFCHWVNLNIRWWKKEIIHQLVWKTNKA